MAARIIYSGRVSVDTYTTLLTLAPNVLGTVVTIQVTDGGGAGSDTLDITFQSCPNDRDSDAAKVFITESTVFPAISIASGSLPYTDVFLYQMTGTGRFFLNHSGGTKVFNVNIWAYP